MVDLRPVLFVIGILLSTLAVAMMVPAIVDAAVGHANWQVFTASSAVTVFVGVTLVLTMRSGSAALDRRQAFLLTAVSWIFIAFFAALPFHFSSLGLSLADSFFESMSGVTTTGSTVIVGLDGAPPGILLWRALLQWLGGIGIIVVAVAVMPMLQVGGMQLFKTEAFDTPDKVMPRAAEIAGSIGVVYLGLTLAWTAMLWGVGMSGFDALCHAMTTIATGGFSTRDASIGHFDSPAIDGIITLGMIAGSLPFILYVRMSRGDWGALGRDSQVFWFLGIAGSATLMITLWHWANGPDSLLQSLRFTSFNAVSVMTGTGYATTDYSLWGGMMNTAMLILMFVGGCAGSTTCGIKVFRFQVLYATARSQLRRLTRPHGVFIAYYNRTPIPDAAASAVMSFFFLYMLCFALFAVALGAIGLDFITAISGAATAISNVGPGLGPEIGPAGTFAGVPEAGKWMLAAAMLLGRLELFTVLVLFTASFWRS